MPELVQVTAVDVVGEHRLRLSFEDGSEGEVQFGEGDWSGVFAPLRDPTYFARVTLDEEMGTIVWPNGADMAPETLHLGATRGRDRQPA
jgi:hypothetical protein